jgi:fructoselysine-6-P-deglycase FrlB-like protein
MSEIEREIASQPDCWRRAEKLAADSVLVLPHAGERVVALGCGTSWFIAQAYAARRAELHMGLGVTDAYTPPSCR